MANYNYRLTVYLKQDDSACFITSEHDGLFEICHDLGAMVKKGDVVARVHDMKTYRR